MTYIGKFTTALKDTFNGYLRARPDLYLLAGMALATSILAVSAFGMEHGTMSATEAQSLTTALDALSYLIIGFPFILGLSHAGIQAFKRRSKRFDTDEQAYVTVSSHRSSLERVRAQTREDVLEELREAGVLPADGDSDQEGDA